MSIRILSLATYQVRAEQTADNPTFNNVGMRTITGVQVDGNQVTISLDPTDTIAGTSYFDYNAFQTFMFDLSYEVTQLRDVELANGETVAAGGTYANTSITNLTVDDFQEAEVTNKAGKTIPYRYYDPIQSAGKDADGKYPVVIFLHGAGESGDNNLSPYHREQGRRRLGRPCGHEPVLCAGAAVPEHGRRLGSGGQRSACHADAR